ncbi:MAG: acetylornithine aminotransferase [Actinobacteria bacterium RBG_16_70_17]|nr:MAG: acetylornithine aminotransferase [Actinobacteria bacterium RBG_16_70_17]
MPSALLHPFSSPRRAEYINIVRGLGAVVWDDQGREYVDGMASLWYMNIGHGREEMAEAIGAQARTLAAYQTFEPFSNPWAERAADLIAGLAPMADSRIFFCNSGSEAVDTAVKVARIAHREAGHPERRIVISRERAYHGTNYGGTSLQGIPPNRDGFGPLLPGVLNVVAEDEEAMKQVFADHGDEIAAVITEPLQGAGGVWPPPPGYLEHLRDLCNAHGAYLIHDEVITGFGRLGSWFGSQFYGVTPDLITFAKAVTSGYVPLAGVIVGPAVRAALEAEPGFVLRTGYTYSGHPLAAAAALKALEIQEREGLVERAVFIKGLLEPGLQGLWEKGLVTDVRGEGAVWAVSVPAGTDLLAVRDGLLEQGVILRAIPPNSLSMCPPLVITEGQIGQIVQALDKVLRTR